MHMGRERNIAVCIILTIVTCGIYGCYWIVMMNDELLEALHENGTSGLLALVLTIITCGIYGLYWMYQLGQRIDRLNATYGRYTDNSGLLYLIVDLVGLGIVVYGVLQNELNQYYRFLDATWNQGQGPQGPNMWY